MTLREIIDVVREDGRDPSWPLQVLFAMTGILRTWAQKEASTFEGECAGVLALTRTLGIIGRMPTAGDIDLLVAENPNLMAVDVPLFALEWWCSAKECEELS